MQSLVTPRAEAHAESHPLREPADADLPARQCGRCRAMFAGDPTLNPTALPDWWVCPPCRAALFGRVSVPSEGRSRRRTGDTA
jgi:hypothetical protein